MSLEPSPAVYAEVAKLFGAKIENVAKNYPLLYHELRAHGLADKYEWVIALATVGTENAGFDVRREIGSKEYFIKNYWGKPNVRKNLGNIKESDSYTYCGRGLLQITGRYNYEKYGKRLAIDLLANPDAALVPVTAVKIFRAYFADHGLDIWANRWGNAKTVEEKETSLQKCRKLVNGGLNGYPKFKKLAEALLKMS